METAVVEIGSTIDFFNSATVLEVAHFYLSRGLSVIPVKSDGSKSPLLGGWRQYSDRLPTEAELDKWFGGEQTVGIGVVPGPASGNLVVLDFECKSGQSAFAEFATGLPTELAAAISLNPVVRTPSGGRHVWVRLSEPAPGGRLARYAKGGTKIEVRGLGHQVLAPGCPRSCHKLNEHYVFESEGWLRV